MVLHFILFEFVKWGCLGQKIFVQSLQKQITGFIFSSIIVGTSWSYYLSNGYPKIKAILRQGRVVNHKAVQRIMQKYGWPCRVKVKKRKQTGQPHYVANNLMNREFTSQKRLEKLLINITYLPFGGKTLYLSSILD